MVLKVSEEMRGKKGKKCQQDLEKLSGFQQRGIIIYNTLPAKEEVYKPNTVLIKKCECNIRVLCMFNIKVVLFRNSG